MYITKVEITNFQKHAHLVVDLINGVNVIYGASGSGKSCFVRSLRWVILNDINIDIRKEGTKKTSVKVTFDSGVEIERIKSASINQYRLILGKEVKEYNAIGRNIPDDILQVINMLPITIDKEEVNLNIANQISLPFLMDKSPNFRMKLFNKMTGNDVLDNVFQGLNRDILRIGKEEKFVSEQLEENKGQLNTIEATKNLLQAKYDKFVKKLKELKTTEERYVLLSNISQQLNAIGNNIIDVEEEIDEIRTVDLKKVEDLKQVCEKLNKLNTLSEKNKKLQTQLSELESKKINIPNVDLDKLKSSTEKHKLLTQISNGLNNLSSEMIDIEEELEISNQKIEQAIKEQEELLKSISVCPFFKKPCPLNEENDE